MDTLSRKHRLRQQQQHQEQPSRVVVPTSANQQVLYANCDKNHCHRFAASTSCKNNNNNNSSNNEDNSDDEEQFKVFQVVELGKGLGQQQQLSAVQVERAGERLNGSKSSFRAEQEAAERAPTQIERREKNDELFSIVYMNPTSYSSLKKRNHSLASSNNADSGSTRSNAGYSSGFQSEGSGPRAGTGKSSGSATSQQLSKRQSGNRNRSRLIDDLDRLMGEADRCSGGGSPAESYLSSGLASHELDYLTLCRDEFSSFITATDQSAAGQPFTSPVGPTHSAGPVLVGVHHDKRPELEPAASPTSSGGSPEDFSGSCTSSGGLSRTASRSPVSLAGEDERWPHQQRLDSYGAEVSCEERDDLSHLLELHLSRVESLLRLARGDQSVTFEEAFGRSDDEENQIHVSEEHRTLVEYRPLKRRPTSMRVLQEVCSVTSDEEELDQGEIQVERHLCETHFLSLLGSAQTSACLNWNLQLAELDQVDSLMKCQSTCTIDQQVDVRRRRRLEESLLRGLLEGADATDSPDPVCNRNADYLVSTVKRHMSEFIDNYNAYQSQLMTQTSFGADWHQNWLFAYKRPSDTGEHQEVCKKRVKMTPPADGSEATQDLIKYSTLVLSRCKPIKLTYPPKTNWPLTEVAGHYASEPLAELESCYLAQAERSEELGLRALESRHETDVCRLLLSDIFADNVSENEMRPQKGKRPLHVRYDLSSSVAPGDAGLSFAAHGYLFEISSLRRMANSDRRRLARLRGEILRRFLEIFKVGPSGGLLDAAEPGEQVRFVTKLANVELINRLPVIQFCAKVDGALPISIRWFREDEEVSSVSSVRSRRHLRYRTDRSLSGNWPIELEANHDYEYQNQWSSWYRFRRRQGDILFEIREADLEMDYGQRFRCVVQNHCSRSECTFSLARRQEEVKSERKSAEKRRDGRALLRTWSQRTLHKPQPQTDVSRSELRDRISHQVTEEKGIGAEEGLSRIKSWQQTVGRRSALLAEPDEVKFGRDFPYHPENLLKRLEENKFCVNLKCKIVKTNSGQLESTGGREEATVAGNETKTVAEATSTSTEPSRQFTDLPELHEGLSSSPRAERRQSFSRQQLQLPKAETALDKQQVKVEVQPKPRSRLRVGALVAAECGERIQQVQLRSTGLDKDDDHQRQVCAPQQVQDVGRSTLQPRATREELQHQQEPSQRLRLVGQRLNDIGQTKKATTISTATATATATVTAIKPEVIAKPPSLDAADWIPKANVKSLISRFS